MELRPFILVLGLSAASVAAATRHWNHGGGGDDVALVAGDSLGCLRHGGDACRFEVHAFPNTTFAAEASEDLSGSWQESGTVATLGLGLAGFIGPDVPHFIHRFYRLRQP